MANPNLATTTSVVAKILASATLATTDTDITVPTGKAWKIVSATLCSRAVGEGPITVTVSILTAAGQTARRVVAGYALAAQTTGAGSGANSANITELLPTMLPEGAVIRVTGSLGNLVDLVISGTELG